MKKLFLIIAFGLAGWLQAQTTINTDIFGQNLWFFDIANLNSLTSYASPPIISQLPKLAAAGVKTIRIGGRSANWNSINNNKLLGLVNDIQAAGMKVVIQVSFDAIKANLPTSDPNYLSQTTQANTALSVINFLNVTNSKNVTDWIISNEPDGPVVVSPNQWGFGWSSTTGDAANIKTYISQFSSTMKTTTGPAINIIGPELTTHYPSFPLAGYLTSGTSDITGDVDVYSFHMYPSATLGSRSTFISYPSATFKPKLQNLSTLIGSSKPIAVTEFNLAASNSTSYDSDPVNGLDSRSYLAGQMLAELYAVAMDYGQVKYMNMWSIKEGSPDWGFLRNSDGGYRSTYHHYGMMANNFSGTYLPNLYTNSSNYKAFGYINSTEVGVMIMNQNQTTPSSTNTFRIKFDGSTSPSGLDIGVLLNAGKSWGFYDCAIRSESSVLLKFNVSTGALISRTEYNIEDAVNDQAPKTWVPPSVADGYIRDIPADNGNEPDANGNPWDLVDGTDIWVRNTADTKISTSGPDRYANEHQHQAPVWSSSWVSTPSSRPVVYVKVRNRGCSSVNGRVHLYYHKLTINDAWNTTSTAPCTNCHGVWEEVFNDDADGDGVIDGSEVEGTSHDITLAAGEEGVVQVVWNNTQNNSVFTNPATSARNEWCLLARFTGGNDLISSSEQVNVSAATNAKAYNNIAQKNVLFLGCTGSCLMACAPIDVGNYSRTTATTNRIGFVDDGTSLFAPSQGRITVDLGANLFTAWASGGHTSTGSVLYGTDKYLHTVGGTSHHHDYGGTDPNPYQVVLTSTMSTLSNIALDTSEVETTCTTIQFYPGTADSTSYVYHYLQAQKNPGTSTYTYTGAAELLIPRPACDSVSAGPDDTLYKYCETDLTAIPDISGATYTWRDMTSGSTLSTSRVYHVNPPVTTTYEVEMLTTDNCLSYDFITVVRDTLSADSCMSGMRLAHNAPKQDPVRQSKPTQQAQSPKNDIAFSAYPNPFSSELTIAYDLQNRYGTLVISEAATGRIIIQSALSPGRNNIIFDRLTISPGMYICTVTTEDGTTRQFKLVNIK